MLKTPRSKSISELEMMKGTTMTKTPGKQLVVSFGLVALALTAILMSGGTANAQNDPGETAFQEQGQFDYLSHEATFENFSVPAGSRLVIESLDIWISIAHNAPPNWLLLDRMGLFTNLNGTLVGHPLPKPTLQFSSSTRDYYRVFITTKLYADHTPPGVDFYLEWQTLLLMSQFDMTASVSGHLVCARALQCAPGVVGDGPAGTAPLEVFAGPRDKPRPDKVAKLRRW